MSSTKEYPLLDSIDRPDQLKQLAESSLPEVCRELREYLIEEISQCGGHFASNLGTVELAVALHYVFNTPKDKIIWDVGHQAYPHKILTGRRDQIQTIRQWEGLTSFPSRNESEYDCFGVGHSSTSVGAALGMAIARDLRGEDQKVVAVIGDGAMTAGMAFEAMNHAGVLHSNMLIILNDNDMSISPNVGALSNYFARLLSGRFYTSVREGSKQVLSIVPPMKEFARRAEEHVKGMMVQGTLFEEMGLNYIGPVDGHDVHALVATLENLRDRKDPQLLHIVTAKGKGYGPAEADPVKYHGVSKFDPRKGIPPSKSGDSPTYSQVFGDWLCDMAAKDSRLTGITPAMREGSGLIRFSELYPNRYFDVGIAEQHSVTLAAGMACEGLKPVVAIYSTFLQRAYDQLIHDVALQDLDVTFAIDRAGLVGPDGPTHAGSFDLSFLRCIPNMVIMTPADENECRQMLTTAYEHPGPAAVRYPRGKGPGTQIDEELKAIPIGVSKQLRRGKKMAFLAFGSMVPVVEPLAEEYDATLINMRFIKPLDVESLAKIALSHEVIVTIEENTVQGGGGSSVNEFLCKEDILISTLNIGLPDNFIESGSRERLLQAAKLDEVGIKAQIDAFLTKRTCQKRPTRINSY
ncbi:MAG TPA: 1-deoxy-D-xylulose-5-phosphate synthase [Gammaproteobacteria bacterium]|nr:1-deoxy-D-xylulose-5-phosphate synthase [Gammaproteobacteria bacterium]